MQMIMQLFYIFKKKKNIPHSADQMAGTSFPRVIEEERQSEAFKVSLLNKYQWIKSYWSCSSFDDVGRWKVVVVVLVSPVQVQRWQRLEYRSRLERSSSCRPSGSPHWTEILPE